MMLVLAFLCLAGALALIGQLLTAPKRERQESLRRARAYRSEERRVGKEGRSRWSPYH